MDERMKPPWEPTWAAARSGSSKQSGARVYKLCRHPGTQG